MQLCSAANCFVEGESWFWVQHIGFSLHATHLSNVLLMTQKWDHKAFETQLREAIKNIT